jgi:monofunctional biosynthetic peptidoglycan transglycosylase
MLIRIFEGWFDNKDIGINYKWVPYDEISPNVFRAVIAAEDGRFMMHGGIDWKAVEAAKRYNEIYKGRKVRGASTITMQTAKNVFLWHGRNYIRKAFEVYFTYLIEFLWGKKRILEIYVNIVEFGNGIYGIEAASRFYFNKSAKDLTARESAALASILPNPRQRSPLQTTPRQEHKIKFIMGRMNSVRIPK